MSRGLGDVYKRQGQGNVAANKKKYEYFFQVGANSKDEITLVCGAFTMKGIASQAGITGMAQLTKATAKVGGDYALAGLSVDNGVWHWVVDKPSIAQRTLYTIDRFIETVDSKRAALGAIQNHCPEIVHPKGRYIKHSHYKKLMVPLEPFFLPLIL